MYDLKTILLAKRFRRNLDIAHLTVADIAMLEIIKNKTAGNPVRDATIENGIAYFDRVTASQPLVSLKLNIPVTQTGSGTPSPDNIRDFIGFSGVNIQRTGKNLFNGTNVINGSIHGITNIITVATTPPELGLIYVPCKSNTTYTISKLVGERFVVGYTTETPDAGVLVNSKIVDHTASSITITTGADAKYIVAFVYNSNYDVVTEEQMINSVQVELGSQSTPYEPYNGNTYTITFGQTIYSGILDILAGKLSITHELATFDGSENWVKSPNRPGAYYIAGWVDTNSLTNTTDHLQNICTTVATYAEMAQQIYACLFRYDLFIKVDNDLYPTLEDFKNFLSQNNLQVWYPLATPIEIQLTPTQISTLIGENVIFADVADVTECKYTRK